MGDDVVAAQARQAAPQQPAGPAADPAMGPSAWPLSDTVDLQYFSSPVPEFKVRGPDYLQDKKKVRPVLTADVSDCT